MFEKIIYIVIEILRSNNDYPSIDVLENSSLIFEESNDRFTLGTYILEVKVLPEFFTKHFSDLERIKGVIQHYIAKTSDIEINEINIKPDYDKITILTSEVVVIETPWDEINNLQKELIKNIKISYTSIDFQNVGNTSRTIMDKLARIVFNPEIHIAPKDVDVRTGKYKNQFHTYISSVLSGGQNKELRLFSESAINFTEKAIDLMNQTTHKLDVQKHFAQVCVISTVSVINLIKAIKEL